VEVLDLEVSVTHGDVPESAKQYAAEKIAQLARFTKRPIVFASLRLSLEPRRAIERPAVAEATLDLGGQIIRAHVAAQDPMAAIDLLDDRLRRRLERQARRTNRSQQHRAAASQSTGWRHGDLPTQRPEYFDRPIEEREVVRHKTFALEPMTCDEAAWDLDMLGHDFYLVTEIESGSDAVICHVDDDGHLELHRASTAVEPPNHLASTVVVSSHAPPELTLQEAQERLDASRERFVFFVNVETNRGNVVYLRYDGHYGLINPA
jgi:ribosomal subunit interface protein